MVASTLMSVSEYLSTTFEGADREYVDGEVVERNMGNINHGLTQAQLAHVFMTHREQTGWCVVTEVRHRVQPTRFRIPDVAVYRTRPAELVPSEAPLIAVEVLSPDDRIGYVVPKLEEYERWGVRHIWMVDPEDRKLFTYGREGLHEVTGFEVAEYGVTIAASAIFGAL